MTEKDRNHDKSEYQRGESKQEERDTKRDGETKTVAPTLAPPPVLRSAVPMFVAEGEVKPTPDELRALMAPATLIEVLASDGTMEVIGAALTVSASDWRPIAQGLKLETGQDWLVHGPGLGDVMGAAGSIVGYGLLIDGTQVAWSARPDELRLGPGGTLNLKDDVIF